MKETRTETFRPKMSQEIERGVSLVDCYRKNPDRGRSTNMWAVPNWKIILAGQ